MALMVNGTGKRVRLSQTYTFASLFVADQPKRRNYFHRFWTCRENI